MNRFFKLMLVGAAVAAGVSVALTLLPNDPYIRWQSVQTEAFARLGWVYERTHYDPTPVDVAFIGTSHSMNGIDAARVAQGLGEAGLRDASGRCPTATNFAIPTLGRDLHYEVEKQILETKAPKLLVIEVVENESRQAHGMFPHVAPVKDVLTAPVLINVRYFENVARMPLRQLDLAMKTAFPKVYGLKAKFDLADYDGSTVDNTRVINVAGRGFSPFRDHTATPKELDDLAASRRQTRNFSFLGPSMANFEYAVPRYYMDKMLALAKAKGVRVAFLYLPAYDQPPLPMDTSFYDGHGNILTANDLLADKSLWLENDHMNAQGAARYSARLASLIAPELQATGSFEPQANPATPASACSNGYPQRPVTKPWRPRI